MTENFTTYNETFSYLNDYSSGKWLPPSSDVIHEWMNKYLLTVQDLCNITGYKIRALERVLDKSNKTSISYAACRLFLIWSKEINESNFLIGEKDWFGKVRIEAVRNNISLTKLCKAIDYTEHGLKVYRYRYPDKVREKINDSKLFKVKI